jgi:hypothetical protein
MNENPYAPRDPNGPPLRPLEDAAEVRRAIDVLSAAAHVLESWQTLSPDLAALEALDVVRRIRLQLFELQ